MVEEPEVPVKPDARGRVRKTIVRMILALLLGAFAALAVGLLDGTRHRGSVPYLDFQAAVRESKEDMRGLLKKRALRTSN